MIYTGYHSSFSAFVMVDFLVTANQLNTLHDGSIKKLTRVR